MTAPLAAPLFNSVDTGGSSADGSIRVRGGIKMTVRANGRFDFGAVRVAIGEALRGLHSAILRESIPDTMAELLRLLDRPESSWNNRAK